MNPALRSSAAHVFVESLEAPELTAEDAHHLFRVMRLRDGESVTVSDGRGSWRRTEVHGGALRPVGSVVHEDQLQPFTIATAIPKGERAEWMVQKLTEVGVAEIRFVDFERSVVRWEGDRALRQLARAQRVAREAAMQSRRVWLPTVTGPVQFAFVAAEPGVVLADPGGGSLRAMLAPPSAVVIGPEGGFAPAELAIDLPSVCLSALVLRVETAAIVAAARLMT